MDRSPLPVSSSGHRAVGGRPREIASNRPRTLLVHGTLLLGATVAICLVNGFEQGCLGVFLLGAGLVMTLCPPRVRVDWRLWAAAGGIIAASALAFLPAHWFSVPPWRLALEAVPVIPLPASVSSVPWETGFWLGIMALSALVGLFTLAHPLRTAGLVALGTAAVMVCVVYTVLAIYSQQAGWHPPLAGDAAFGFLPNRNHTATFLVVGSILSMGTLRVAWRDGRWTFALLAGIALALCVTALGFYSASRAGVVFLVVGTLVWAGGLGSQARSVPVLVSIGILLLAGGLLFTVSGSEVRNRLLPAWNKDAAPATAASALQSPRLADPRVFVYEDACRLVRDVPMTGVGLGAFAMVFPQYRQKSLNDATALHPESDWLMLAAEAGVPAAILAGILWWLLLRRSRLWLAHPSWPLRWACTAAVTTACLHGVVDVPLHRVVLGWWVLVLAGLGLHGGWSANTATSKTQHALFVVGGIAALALGTSLVRAQWFGAEPLPPFAQEHTQEEALRLFRSGDTRAAVHLLETQLRAAPLNDAFYHQLGTLLAQAPHADAAVDQLFLAQRLVSPNDPTVPFVQGSDWMLNDTTRTAALWRDALARRERIDHAQGVNEDTALGLYHRMMEQAAEFPELQQALLDAKWPQARFALAWLMDAAPETRQPNVARFVDDRHFLAQLDRSERVRLMSILYEKGETVAVDRLSGLSDWHEAARQITIRRLQEQGRYEELVRTICARTGVRLDLPTEDFAASTTAEAAGSDPNDPENTFTTYWRLGNRLSARRVLDDATRKDAGRRPSAETWRLKAALAAEDNDWPTAWQCLSEYLQAAGKDNQQR